MLHLAVLVLLLQHHAALRQTPKERSISVDIVSAAQYAATLAAPLLRRPAAPVAEVPPPAPVEQPTAAAPTGMVQATHMQAGAILADPANRQVRESLPLLASSERMTQLCDIEALEQIHLWKAELQPDILVASAMRATRVSARVVEADGGAFRNARQWYEIKFRCVVADDLQSVVDFQFSVGDLIPESAWAAHDLTAEEIE